MGRRRSCRTWCRRCCISIEKFILLGINFVDLACGAAAFGFAAYLDSNLGTGSPIGTIILVSVALGGAFILSALLGFGGIVFDSGCLLSSSRCLALPLALLEFLAGCYMALEKGSVSSYAKKHDPKDADMVKKFGWIVVAALFGASFFELLRYKLTGSLKRRVGRDLAEQMQRLADDEAEAVQRGADQEQARGERYSRYREHFRQKYAPPTEQDVEAAQSDGWSAG
eukprot:CAMPEP_0119266810 /NCGR_PEP_ID=MMETSP1329-20130426/5170_1 /TAXON_ID=114041 /ORGANISM="Genus nov. species nov., Strain RCC1024" /LENGTH=225 /DNA_ID=CAMNT_0007266709 /DNA_START=187 /DNA_END=861 /DNA_ORIENTATION=+